MTEDARLPTHLWANALVRQWNGEGYPSVLRRRGDKTAGTVIIAIDRCDGTAVLLGERRDLDGARQWMALGAGPSLTSQEEQDYLEKAIRRDRDVWILGVECAQGWPPLNAPLDPGLANGASRHPKA